MDARPGIAPFPKPEGNGLSCERRLLRLDQACPLTTAQLASEPAQAGLSGPEKQHSESPPRNCRPWAGTSCGHARERNRRARSKNRPALHGKCLGSDSEDRLAVRRDRCQTNPSTIPRHSPPYCTGPGLSLHRGTVFGESSSRDSYAGCSCRRPDSGRHHG